MKKIFLSLVSLFIVSQSLAQHFISKTLLATKTASQVTAMIGAGGPYLGANIYKISYHTVDAFNNPTIATGAFMIPIISSCNSFPLLSYGHGTVLKKNEVPSAQHDNYDGLFFASKGYIVSMPDYIGLGDNPGFHPFLHSKSEATATIDLMRAVREYIHDSTTLQLDGNVFVTGYSQGGHSAMATLKYIQDNNLGTEFHVVAGAPLSGPYSLSKAQLKVYADSLYTYNAFTPYVINSYQYVYGNLYTNLQNYYDAPYNTSIPPYLTGNSTFNSLNAILPVNAYQFMQDSVLTSLLADTIVYKHPLKRDLMLNDLYSWKPLMPLKMCYCGSDPLVLPGNSIMAYDTMTAKGAPNVSILNVVPGGDHFTCFIPALTSARAFFEPFRTDCSKPVGLNDLQKDITSNVSLFPNPSSDIISIKTTVQLKQIEILDMNGKSIMQKETLSDDQLSIRISNLNNGFYILKSIDSNGNSYFNKFSVLK